jgi:hypothetical protein
MNKTDYVTNRNYPPSPLTGERRQRELHADSIGNVVLKTYEAKSLDF